MQISVVTLSDKKGETFHVDESDNIHSLMSKIFERFNIPIENQILQYAGKILEHHRLLKDYRIQHEATLHLSRKLSITSAEDVLGAIPEEATFHSLKDCEQIRRAWKRKAQDGNFDDDLCIVDPEAHYSYLDGLEDLIISKSEFELSRGSYDILSQSPHLNRFRYSDASQTIPSWLQDSLQQLGVSAAPFFITEYQEMQSEAEKSLTSIWISYQILCTVLRSFSVLEEAEFCQYGFISVLVVREVNVAEIVKIFPDTQLKKIKNDLENAFGHILEMAFGGSIEEGTIEGLRKFLTDLVEEPCLAFLRELGLSLPETTRSTADILNILRITALFSDLAMVSYVGSHGSQFDRRVGLDSAQIKVADQSIGFGFSCSLKRFACLDGFLDSRPVWTFEFLTGDRVEPQFTQQPGGRMQLLTRMNAFADIWGPVSSIPTKDDKYIKQYNVSKGVICAISDKRQPRADSAIPCHWYNWAAFRRKTLSRFFRTSEEKVLKPDDLLLIGELDQNISCSYTLEDFGKDFDADIDVLGTSAEAWRLDSRGVGLSFSRIIGISVTGTQKRFPQTTLKQIILDKWSNNPNRANPGVLNMSLGLEISHCTGNARRIPLKSLMLLKAVQPLLQRQIPDWQLTPWGIPFLAALKTPKQQPIFDVWKNYRNDREKIAELVCCVLEVLDTTGYSNEQFTAGFFHDNQELSVKIDPRANNWTLLLRDSHLMAVFPVVNEICLECHTSDHSTATCNNRSAATVLQTQIAIKSREPVKRIILRPYRQALRRVDNRTNQNNTYTVEKTLRQLFSPISHALSDRSVDGKEKHIQQTWDQSSSLLVRGSASHRQRPKSCTSRAESHTSQNLESNSGITTTGNRIPPAETPLTTASEQHRTLEATNVTQDIRETVNSQHERPVNQGSRGYPRIVETVADCRVEEPRGIENFQQVPARIQRDENDILNNIMEYEFSDNEGTDEHNNINVGHASNPSPSRIAFDIPQAPTRALPMPRREQYNIVQNIDEYYISDNDFEEEL